MPKSRPVRFPRSADEASMAYAAYERARDEDCLCPCEYGHLECSASQGGLCSDELLSTFPHLTD